MKRGELPQAKGAYGTVFEVPVDLIDVPEGRLRSLKPTQAEAIGKAIAADRQYDPIAIRMRVGTDRFWLVDGLHRLEGCRMTGQPTVQARMGPAAADKALMQEVLSAWARADDDAFDVAAQIAAIVDLAKGASEEINSADDVSLMIGLATRWDQSACDVLRISRANLFNYLKLHRFYSGDQRRVLREKGCAGELMPLHRLASLPPESFAVAWAYIEATAAPTIAEALATVAPSSVDPISKAKGAFLGKFAKWEKSHRADFIADLLTRYDEFGNERRGAGR